MSWFVLLFKNKAFSPFFFWFSSAIFEDSLLCFGFICRLKIDVSEFKLHQGFHWKSDRSLRKRRVLAR